MPSVFNLIGERFEEIVKADFSEFVKSDDGRNLPDFLTDGFEVEAKVGFIDYGVQIKGYQVEAFRRRKRPVVYLIGFHAFENSIARLSGKSETKVRTILNRGMRINSAYFVDSEVIANIWDVEKRASVKEQRVYCTLKKRFLDNVISGKSFSRLGIKTNASEFYDFNLNRYVMERPSNHGGSFPYGFILDKERDEVVLDFLKARE